MNSPPKPGSSALRKGRFSQANGVYFITSTVDGRIPWFQEHDLARIMARHLQDLHKIPGAQSLCWVVMPDHFHLLLQIEDLPLSESVRRLKAHSSRMLNQAIGRSGRFWDAGFHAHALRREEDLTAISRYIVANPLRARLVERIGDYPYWNAVWF